MPIVAQAMDDFIRQNVGLSIWRLFFKAAHSRAEGAFSKASERSTRLSTASSPNGAPVKWEKTCSLTCCGLRTQTAAP